ncbi:mechanosensitive ion channel family protein [Halopelagius longus]|nr:hypothetical protein [Halopelagius longus]RDI69663.1 hypothetical protein DWB78_17995 [Halopelagius longus]
MIPTVLQLEAVPEFLQQTISQIVAFLPRLVSAIVILIIGWLIGIVVGKAVQRLADGADLDKRARGTPLGRMFGDGDTTRSGRGISSALGSLTKWFIVALAVLAMSNVLAIPLLSQWISRAVSFLPTFVAGLLIILFGFIFADFVGDMIMRTRAATETAYTSWFALGTRMFLYFTVVVIGLDTMGVDVQILYLFARALAWGLAAAIALGVGISVGVGGHEYVSDNIDRWMSRASNSTPSPQTQPSDDD